jgi:glycosyltransferase involved in cell wall biosynthesis
MHVVIPIAGDPWKPRPSGIMTYAVGLAKYLEGRGVFVEFLSTGEPHNEGRRKATPVASAGSGELAFARRLSRHVRRRMFAGDTVVVANTEWYAWAFHRARPHVHVVLVAHGPSLPTLRARKPWMAAPFKLLIEPRGVEAASVIIAIDGESETYFATRYPAAKVRRVPVGIDTEHFKPVPREVARRRWGVEGRPAILFAGRFVPEKDPALAAAVFRRVLDIVPGAVLLIAGSGPLSKPFDRARDALGPERIRLLGFVPRTDLPSLYSAADALILTSTIEQMPTVSLEALACGTPVFSTATGDMPSLLGDPVLGAICDRSAERFAHEIATRIPETEVDRARLGEIRRKTATQYSWDAIGPQVLEVMNACL